MAPGPTTDRSRPLRQPDARKAGAAKTAKARAEKPVRAANAARDATFTLTLLVVHPDMAPQMITDELGLKPYRSMERGAPMKTLAGAAIGGTYKDSRWNYIEHHAASHIASRAIDGLLRNLEKHASFLRAIQQTGARISMHLNLPASHRGESLDAATLRLAGELGIAIGFEIFPDWDGKPNVGQARGK